MFSIPRLYSSKCGLQKYEFLTVAEGKISNLGQLYGPGKPVECTHTPNRPKTVNFAISALHPQALEAQIWNPFTMYYVDLKEEGFSLT
jgi:hypothetical protein